MPTTPKWRPYRKGLISSPNAKLGLHLSPHWEGPFISFYGLAFASKMCGMRRAFLQTRVQRMWTILRHLARRAPGKTRSCSSFAPWRFFVTRQISLILLQMKDMRIIFILARTVFFWLARFWEIQENALSRIWNSQRRALQNRLGSRTCKKSPYAEHLSTCIQGPCTAPHLQCTKPWGLKCPTACRTSATCRSGLLENEVSTDHGRWPTESHDAKWQQATLQVFVYDCCSQSDIEGSDLSCALISRWFAAIRHT